MCVCTHGQNIHVCGKHRLENYVRELEDARMKTDRSTKAESYTSVLMCVHIFFFCTRTSQKQCACAY